MDIIFAMSKIRNGRLNSLKITLSLIQRSSLTYVGIYKSYTQCTRGAGPGIPIF